MDKREHLNGGEGVFLSVCARWIEADPPAHLPCSAFEPHQKINWQTVGVGFRTVAQVADGIARSEVTD